MRLIPPMIEVSHVQQLPIVKASAAKIGVVEVSNQMVPTAMAVDPGTIVRGMLLETLRGRRPLYRLGAFCAHQDTARLLGKAVAPEAWHADTVGRVLDRLSEIGTMKRFTACAVRADQVCGLDTRSGHFATTSVSVSGESLAPEDPHDHQEQAVPLTMPHGSSKAKRPDLTPCVFSTRCVERAIPLWGNPHEGKASEHTVHHLLLSDIATCLAQHGVAPGASLSVADAALVTQEPLTALGDTRCTSRFPATSNAGGRLIAEAVAHHTWAALGVIAPTQPTPHRPGTSSQASEGAVTLSGTPSRAVVIPSSAQDKRRQQRLERESQAS